MNYAEFKNYLSEPRLARYYTSCGNDSRRSMKLYRGNIRLSQKFFSILCIFEVVLRNKIDQHYRAIFQPVTNEWLLYSSNPGGFLTSHGCGKSLQSVQEGIRLIARYGGVYSHDKLVAELNFGFWRYQFASREFMSAGSSLHHIFPNRPVGTSHTDLFNKLGFINKIRNRIAHHEPICFGVGNTISSMYARQHYTAIVELLQWMDIDHASLLWGIDGIAREFQAIDAI